MLETSRMTTCQFHFIGSCRSDCCHMTHIIPGECITGYDLANFRAPEGLINRTTLNLTDLIHVKTVRSIFAKLARWITELIN